MSVITVYHQLDTVIGSDKIAVLGDGIEDTLIELWFINSDKKCRLVQAKLC